MKETVKSEWDRDGETCLVLGPNVFVEQWWTPVKWPDEEDPTFHKTAAINFEEADISTLSNKSSFQFPKLEDVHLAVSTNLGRPTLPREQKLINKVYNIMVINKKR